MPSTSWSLILAGGIAGTLRTALTLVWTAGFVPTFLEPGAASVLLAKPVERWQLLLGKYVGVLAFVGFPGGALRRSDLAGSRDAHPSLEHDLLVVRSPALAPVRDLLQLSRFLLAVVTRSTVACVFGCALLAAGLGNQLWQRHGPQRFRAAVLARRYDRAGGCRILDFPKADRCRTDSFQFSGRAPIISRSRKRSFRSNPGTTSQPACRSFLRWFLPPGSWLCPAMSSMRWTIDEGSRASQTGKGIETGLTPSRFLTILKWFRVSRSGGMADAPDSKSGGVTPCGFKSHLRYYAASSAE